MVNFQCKLVVSFNCKSTSYQKGCRVTEKICRLQVLVITYASVEGFGIRLRNNRYDNAVISQRFLCCDDKSHEKNIYYIRNTHLYFPSLIIVTLNKSLQFSSKHRMEIAAILFLMAYFYFRFLFPLPWVMLPLPR